MAHLFQIKKNEKRTIAVLLPCRERGSKTTKQWLKRLQNYLSETSLASQRLNVTLKSVRIVTLFSCKAREVFSKLDFPNLSGVLSFEPRKVGGARDPGMETPQINNFQVPQFL